MTLLCFFFFFFFLNALYCLEVIYNQPQTEHIRVLGCNMRANPFRLSALVVAQICYQAPLARINGEKQKYGQEEKVTV